jgi:Protein of unknown function (DUF3352)
MNNVRALALLLLVFAALFAAGCGEEAASGPTGASVAPASAPLFVSIETDSSSEQWKQAGALLDKFPGGDKLIASALDELSKEGVDFQRDVEPALGPETDIVALDLSGEGQFVGLTQPDDKQKFEDLMAKGDEEVFTREFDGWTAFADSEATLDEFASARQDGRLADSSDYQDAIDQVDSDGIATLYLNGKALADALAQEGGASSAQLEPIFPGGKIPSFAISLKAEENGVRLEGGAKVAEDDTGFTGENFHAELPEEVPGGALVYLDLNNLEEGLSAAHDALAQQNPQLDQDLARIEAALGVSLEEDVFPLFSGETALYVRPSLIIPEVTLVTHVDDEDAAMATLDKLVSGLGAYLPVAPHANDVDIDGIKAKELPLQPPVSLYWAAFDGHLVLTDSREGIAALRSDDNRLADDEDFKRALEQADVPDETTGFAYVNLHDAISSILGFAGAEMPPDVRANLEPLETFVAYGSKDGTTVRFAAFLAVH